MRGSAPTFDSGPMILREQYATDDLRTTLDRLVRSPSGSNPAFESLLRNYRTYHLVLVVLSGAIAIGFFVFGGLMARRFRTTRRELPRRRSFGRLIYLSAALIGLSLGVIMAVILAANLSTALHPRQGFAGSVGMISTPRGGTNGQRLHQAFADWLKSAQRVPPPTVQRAVERRLAWQRPKAVICTMVLLLIGALGTWRSTLTATSAGRRWRIADAGRFISALVSVPTGLTVMLMVMGNTQASIAPLTMTLFYG